MQKWKKTTAAEACMFTRKTQLKSICLAMAILTLWNCLPGNHAFSALIATEPCMTHPDTTSVRTQLTALLSREDVSAAFLQYGISPAEAEARIRALSDDEVALVAQQLPELPAGGDMGMSGAWMVVMVVVIVAVVAALIILGVWAVNQTTHR